MEWITGKRGSSEDVSSLLSKAETGHLSLSMSAINAREVYYFLRKHHEVSLAEFWRESSATLPVAIEVPSREDIWKAAALKARYPISYADAFAAALAQKHACQLVTGDAEFRSIKGLDLYWFDR
jgi:ribonuclease VapC